MNFIVLCFCSVCLVLVYPMLPVSLDCPFGIIGRLYTVGVNLPIRFTECTPSGAGTTCPSGSLSVLLDFSGLRVLLCRFFYFPRMHVCESI
jgi:hypothetical protein